LSEAITQFREYIRLDRKHRSGGLTPAELERWTRLKRVLGEKFMPGPGDDQPDRRASLRGMGLRFLEMDDNVRRKLEDLYEGALRRAIRGEGHE
jgi:hypothetical protein